MTVSPIALILVIVYGIFLDMVERVHKHSFRERIGLHFAPEPIINTQNLTSLRVIQGGGEDEPSLAEHIGYEMHSGVKIGRGKVEKTVISFDDRDKPKKKRKLRLRPGKKEKLQPLVTVSTRTKRSLLHPFAVFRDVPRHNQINIAYHGVPDKIAAAGNNPTAEAALEQRLTDTTKHQLLDGIYWLSHRFHHRRWTNTARTLGTGAGVGFVLQDAVRNVIQTNEPLTLLQFWQYMKSPQSLPDIWNYISSPEGLARLPEAGLFVLGFFLLTKAVGLGLELGVHRPRFERRRAEFLAQHQDDDILQVKIL